MIKDPTNRDETDVDDISANEPADDPKNKMDYFQHSLKNPMLDEDMLHGQLDSIQPLITEYNSDGAEQVPSKIDPPVERQETPQPQKSNKQHSRFSIGLLKSVHKIIPLMVFIFSLALLPASTTNVFSTQLLEQFELISQDEMLPVFLVLKDQYDSQRLYNEIKNMDRENRRTVAVSKLKEFSALTQMDLRAQIESLERENKIRSPKYLWIANVIGMNASPAALSALAKSPLIARIEYDPLRNVLFDAEQMSAPVYSASGESFRGETRVIAQHVALINAPAVWAQGFEGQGTVVGVVDSGVDFEQPDLAGRMWTHPDYPYHGYSFLTDSHYTLDTVGHGTFCAGIIAGTGASGISTGIAPDSKIMILKVTDGIGNSTQLTVWNAIQFGVEYGVDVLNMSLGWQYGWNPDRVTWRNVLTNTMNAGVSSAVAIGNEGTAGLRTPGDCPPPWLSPDQTLLGGISGTVSVGATDFNDQAAQFSSRGPASWSSLPPFYDYAINPGGGLIRPDIVAPGVDVVSLSLVAGEDYASSSGTSFATPGVAGLMALMYSKKPVLTPEEVSSLLEQNAVPLSLVKNNVTGSGRIDAYETLNAAGGYINIHEFAIQGTDSLNPQTGQTIALDVTLINYGYATIGNVNGILSSDDVYVSVLSNSSSFGDIPGMETADSQNAYIIRFAENIPHNHNVNFTLSLTAAQGLVWQQPLILTAIAPKLEVLLPIVDDSIAGGNNDGIADAGETLKLYFPIANTGGTPASAFVLNVQSASAIATIAEISATTFPQTQTQETLYPYLVIQIDASAGIGDELSFNYSISSGSYEFAGQFCITLGAVMTIQIGSGEMVNSPSGASPINIHYRSLHGQMVYTADELYQSGILNGEGGLIREIGFYISSPPQYPLPNFTIRMKHTAATDAAVHDAGPYSTVLTLPGYTPANEGWDYLQLSAPFAWNGMDNLLIDTAFSQTSTFSSTGQQRTFYAVNGFRFVRADNADQSNVATTTASVNKPQIAIRLSEYPILNGATNLSAQSQNTSISLMWDPSPAPTVQGYNVYRNGSLLASTGSGQTAYTDGALSAATLYYYYVKGILPSGETSASNIVEIRSSEPVSLPLISPEDAIHAAPVQIVISTLTDGATIRYTMDGTDPTAASAIYEEPFMVSEFYNVIKAKAFKPDCFDSDIASAEIYILPVPQDLSASPSPGSVSLLWEPIDDPAPQGSGNALIRSSVPRINPLGYNVYRSTDAGDYVLLNDTPLADAEYMDSGLPTGTHAYIVRAVYQPGESLGSDVASAYVTGVLPLLQFNPPPGHYYDGIRINISSSMGNPTIYYTIDGSEPDENSFQYTGSLPTNTNVLLRAVSKQTDWYDSEVVSASYTFSNVAGDDLVETPLRTELVSAYPNPFNPVSTIHFTIAASQHVLLEVYSLKGQRIKTLADTFMNPGEYRLIWSGEDNNGNRVGSGVYFYRLQTSQTDVRKKVVLLK